MMAIHHLGFGQTAFDIVRFFMI